MKKLFVLLCLLGFLFVPMEAEASIPRQHRIGDMGFHGGISESRFLPRTTETIILAGTARPATVTINMEYQEYVFLNFMPQVFTGTMTVVNGSPANNSTAGTFNVTHTFAPNPGTALTGPVINRTMPFRVYYNLEGNNMIYTYSINANQWTETIVINEEVLIDDVWVSVPQEMFVLDARRSSFWVSVIEDRTPGVNYYRGNINARLFYQRSVNVGDVAVEWEDAGVVEVSKSGVFYGYSSAWSATETHRVNVTVNDGNWAMTYQIRPSVAVNKIMQFEHNEPTVISFEGNFLEVHQSFAGLRYDIFTRPNAFWEWPTFGTLNMDTENIFEQLPAPNMTHIRGHSAEDDIHRLFAMQILQGDPRFFIPEQAMTRGQFVTALVRAINLPVEQPPNARGRAATVHIFSDVSTDRPEFRYIKAANNHRVAFGRADGSFDFDGPLSRQEAAVSIVRALGLTRMGVDLSLLSPFADSSDIASWAIGYTNIALGLGIIGPDANGNFHPTRAISNAQAATFLNTMINYMREGIMIHYADEIVNIVR